jgi:phage terminase large subunit-like protein
VLQKVREGTKIIHLVAPTEADYRDVMIHGPAGLVTIVAKLERFAEARKGRADHGSDRSTLPAGAASDHGGKPVG